MTTLDWVLLPKIEMGIPESNKEIQTMISSNYKSSQ